MRKGTGPAVATGVLALAVGLGIAVSRMQQPSPGPERVTRTARQSTGRLLLTPTPPPDGHLRNV